MAKFGEMRRIFVMLFMFSCAMALFAKTTYKGRVVDEQGMPVSYATVYLMHDPVQGTATNTEGEFFLETNGQAEDTVVVSYVGYEKCYLRLSSLFVADSLIPINNSIVLHEQPIALEEMVVEAKRTRKSKRKMLAHILHAVYTRLGEEFPQRPVKYEIVSDVHMNAQSSPWGMEQMIANVTEEPSQKVDKPDSMQFVGIYCKRYCNPAVRQKIDTVMLHEQDKRMRRMAGSIDSGTVVHRALWKMRLQRDHLLDTSNELRRWKMSSEDNTRCVLTYSRNYSYYLGIVKVASTENLIVDAFDYSLQSYTIDMHVRLSLPISVKMKGTMLEWVNLLNMNEESVEKFRLKRGELHAQVSTIYARRDGVLIPIEKNLHTDGQIEDRNGLVLPLEVWATQQVTAVTMDNVQLSPRYNRSHHVHRVLVPIY